MPYQSIFDSNGGFTGGATGGGFTPTRATPLRYGFQPGQYAKVNAQIAAQKPAKVQQSPQQPQQKPQSFLNKLVGIGKNLGEAAITSEKTAATGIARDLPGGTADIKAQQQQAQQQAQDVQNIRNLQKSGKISQKQAGKITGNIAANSKQTEQAQTKTLKGMPSKGQLAAGFAGTAADIIAGGELPEVKAIAGGGKAAKVLNTVSKVAPRVAANVSAGGLNAAAGGGTKKQVIENAALGAALPEALDTVGKIGAKGVNKVAEALPNKSTKELITNTKTQNVLEQLAQKQADKQNKAAVVDHLPTLEQPVTRATKATPAIDQFHPTTMAFDQAYQGGHGGALEAQAADYIRANPDKAMADYNARAKDKFGSDKVVSGDEGKYVIPGFDSTKSAAYHEPGSALAKVKYQELLADPTTKDKPVLIMSGGSGAGKTSALKRLGINYDNYAAVVDTNSNKLAGTEARIKAATDSGRQVEVFHVHRDPVKAFTQGVIPRGGKEGRIVPIENHLETHYGSHDVIKQLHDTYKNDHRVDLTIASNNHGHGKAKAISIDELPKMRYTKDELRTILKKEVDNAHVQGKVTPEEHALYHGGTSEATPESVGTRPSIDRQPQPERATGQVGGNTPTETKAVKPEQKANTEQGTSKVAQRIAKDIKGEYGDLATYKKINIADQAQKAADLTSNRAELDKVISGEKPLPEGLRATSIIAAVRNDPKLSKDVELLKSLASSDLASESSRSAQELRIARENAKNDPVEAIRQVSKARQKAFEKNGKSVAKATSKEVQAIRKATPKATPKTWNAFLDELKC